MLKSSPPGSSITFAGANVIPSVTKRTAVSVATELTPFIDLSGPDFVSLARASGGFSTVIEFSSAFCLRYLLERAAGPPLVIWLAGDEVEAFRQGQTEPFAASELNSPATGEYQLRLVLEGDALEFMAPSKVRITYRAMLRLERVVTLPEIPAEQHPWPFLPPFLSGGIPSPFTDSVLHMSAMSAQPSPQEAIASTFLPEAAIGGVLDEARLWRHGDRPHVLVHAFEPFTVTLDGSYKYEVIAPTKRVRVWIEAGKGGVQIGAPVGDAKRYFAAFLQGREAQITQIARSVVGQPLVPLVSLVGRNVTGVSVLEIPDFDARAFHIGTSPGQVLAVAIDASAGCEGIVERVEAFVGDFDYGVISDEAVISQVVHHKWNQGGFHRALPAEQTVRISRAGKEEDATVRGTLHLDGLDQVSAETDSNSRTDYVMLAGPATLEATTLVLANGSVLDRDDVDLGPASQANWTSFTQPQVSPPAEGDPDLRTFQVKAHADGYRHLARPFARCPVDVAAVPIGYTRLEAVTGHLFSLGFIRSTFS
jgi:hypothetical protein